jgi:PTH1 family peptidyl-tRNA hydrolase
MGIFKRRSAPEWIVAFLGNPGKAYERTRHNAGFIAGDMLAQRYGVKINKSEYRGYTARITVGDTPVLLLKPQTFMNLSGESVGLAGIFYKIPPERIIMVYDDISLEPAGCGCAPTAAPAATRAWQVFSRLQTVRNSPVSRSAWACRPPGL